MFDELSRLSVRLQEWLTDAHLEWLVNLGRSPSYAWKRTGGLAAARSLSRGSGWESYGSYRSISPSCSTTVRLICPAKQSVIDSARDRAEHVRRRTARLGCTVVSHRPGSRPSHRSDQRLVDPADSLYAPTARHAELDAQIEARRVRCRVHRDRPSTARFDHWLPVPPLGERLTRLPLGADGEQFVDARATARIGRLAVHRRRAVRRSVHGRPRALPSHRSIECPAFWDVLRRRSRQVRRRPQRSAFDMHRARRASEQRRRTPASARRSRRPDSTARRSSARSSVRTNGPSSYLSPPRSSSRSTAHPTPRSVLERAQPSGSGPGRCDQPRRPTARPGVDRRRAELARRPPRQLVGRRVRDAAEGARPPLAGSGLRRSTNSSRSRVDQRPTSAPTCASPNREARRAARTRDARASSVEAAVAVGRLRGHNRPVRTVPPLGELRALDRRRCRRDHTDWTRRGRPHPDQAAQEAPRRDSGWDHRPRAAVPALDETSWRA